MRARRFARTWSRAVAPLTTVRYLAGRTYPLSPEIEREAETAGVLEVKRVRSARRGRKGGAVASEG